MAAWHDVLARMCTPARTVSTVVVLPRYARINVLKVTRDAVIDYLVRHDGFRWLSGGQHDGGATLPYVLAPACAVARTGWPAALPCNRCFVLTSAAVHRSRGFCGDPHVPDLLAFAAGTDLHAHPLCRTGKLILQVRRAVSASAPLLSASVAAAGSDHRIALTWITVAAARCRTRQAACRRCS